MSRLFWKVIYKIRSLLINNPFTSGILVLFSWDHLPKKLLQRNIWDKHEVKADKTMEENVGYAMNPHIQQLVERAKAIFSGFAKTSLKPGEAVLDIGCGTVVILKSLEGSGLDLNGVDMNTGFLELAKKRLPEGHFYLGNYLEDFKSEKKFKLMSLFSVLMYIEPSKLKRFFDKLYSDLAPGGYVFIQYHHALTSLDPFYPDLTYVRYSPLKIEEVTKEKFNIVKHEHFYDGRKIGRYDAKHYYFPDGTNTRLDTIENTSLLIIQKKG